MSSDLEAGAPANVPAPPVLVRATPSSELVSAWTLVLEALGIPHQIVRRDPWFELWVTAASKPRAEAALAAYDRDRREEASAVMPAVPDQGRSAAGVGFVVAIAAFYWVTGARDGGDRGHWFEHGAAIAEATLRAARVQDAPIRRFPWFTMPLLAPFNETFREMLEMRYLWKVPLRLDNRKLVAFLGAEPHTPAEEALRETLKALGCLDGAAARLGGRLTSLA